MVKADVGLNWKTKVHFFAIVQGIYERTCLLGLGHLLWRLFSLYFHCNEHEEGDVIMSESSLLKGKKILVLSLIHI